MKHLFLFFAFFLFSIYLKSQVNTDSIFRLAITDAHAGNYTEALQRAEQVLTANPERFDVIVFIANIYAWKEDYSIALNYIEEAYTINPQYQELYDSWLNILLWSKNYKKIPEVSELAIKNNYPNKYNITLKNAFAFKALGEYQKGINLIDDNKQFLDSTIVEKLYFELKMLHKSKAVSVYYSLNFFDNNAINPYHISYIDFAFKYKSHAFIPRLNYANRINKNDFQIELDYYKTFKNGHSLYTNYGMGIRNMLFPKYRAGIEYYLPFFSSFESSFGGRFLYSANYSTIILTGHLSKYYKNLWFSLRPFYVFNDTKNTLTTVCNIRHYAKNPINYNGLELLYGNTPDESYATTENLLLKNYRIKIEKNVAVLKYNELKMTFAYSYEEYIKDYFRNKFTIEVLFKHKF